MTAFKPILNHLRARLDGEGVPFVIGGAFALAAHGHPRFTSDIDIMVLSRSLDPVHRALSEEAYVRVNEVTFQHAASGLYLDLFLVEDDAQRAAFDRAEEATLYGATGLKVLTPDGLSLMLLREATTGDPSQRPLRLRDLELLATDHELDWAFLRTWTKKMGYETAYEDLQADGKPNL